MTYQDGLEDAAKIAENLCADMTVEANEEPAGLTSTLHRVSAQTAGKIAAALRAMSALSPQALPAPGEVEYIDRGKLEQATDDLIVAVRSSWGIGSAEHNLVRDICDLIGRAPSVSLATVAAANDEGVADDPLTRRAFAIVERMAKWDGSCAIPGDMREVQSIAAAIRLLSQGGGK